MPQIQRLSQALNFITKLETSRIKDQTDRLTCDNYKWMGQSNKQNHFNGLIDDLMRPFNLTKPCNAHFKNTYYISDRLVSAVFEELESKLFVNSTSFATKNAWFKYELHAFDIYGNKLTLAISNEREFEYAFNLYETYKQVIKPYSEKNKVLIARSVANFNRFFFLSGSFNNLLSGKSAHSTSVTYFVNTHYAYRDFASMRGLLSPSIDPNVEYNENVNMNISNFVRKEAPICSYETRRSAHFRWDHYLGNFSIEDFHLDLNYFKCFFMPILEKMNA